MRLTIPIALAIFLSMLVYARLLAVAQGVPSPENFPTGLNLSSGNSSNFILMPPLAPHQMRELAATARPVH